MYYAIKHLHVTCVVLSAAGFLLRGLWMITGSGLLQHRLARVLPQWQLPPVTIWCVTAGRRLLPPRTTLFIDLLRATLADSGPVPGGEA